MTDQPRPIADAQDRRRYFRIADDVFLKLTPIPAEREAEAIARFAESADEISLLNDLLALRNRGLPRRRQLELKLPLAAAYLDIVEQQIDLLAQAVNTLGGVPQEPNRTVDLSAQGVSFQTGHPHTVGSMLEVTLVLFPSRSRVRTLARVVKNIPAGNGVATTGIEFVHLRDADREAIIHHVHLLQLQRLQAEHAVGG